MNDIFKNEERIAYQLDELTESQMNNLITYDRYETDCTNFYTHGHIVLIENALLAEAVAHLSKRQQEVILLSFFLYRSDSEIAKSLNMAQSVIHYHKTKALESLRQFLEGTEL